MKVQLIRNESSQKLDVIYTCSPLESLIINDALRRYSELKEVHNLDRVKALSMLNDFAKERGKYNDEQ